MAELLSQLPAELDVEGMVADAWAHVARTQLDSSGLSAWDLGKVRLCSSSRAADGLTEDLRSCPGSLKNRASMSFKE